MKEAKYTCLAVNYLDEINDAHGNSLDETKELLLRKLRSKVLSKSEIDKISSVLGFDVWRGMVWCDTDIWLLKKHTTSIGLKYRLIGFDELITKEVRDIILKYLNYVDFYSEQDIRGIEQKLQIKIFQFASWQTFTEVKLHYLKSDIRFHFYWKQLRL
jgi:hypothetical protein